MIGLQDIASGKNKKHKEQARQTERKGTGGTEITMFRYGEVKWTREREQS